MKASALLIAGTLLLSGSAAGAADATAPVDEVMEVTVANWSEDAGEPRELFSEDRLSRLFSRDFVALFRSASDNDYAREAGTPFDYDVVVNAQDGCPLQDVTVTQGETDAGVTIVVARYRTLACMGDDAFSETRFAVVEEEGRAVIDDILVDDGSGSASSLKGDMSAIAAENAN